MKITQQKERLKVPKIQRTTIVLPEDLVAQARMRAVEERRSLSKYIQVLVETDLEHPRPRRTEELSLTPP